MSKNVFRHLFFDLDRTLWDYEINCRVTMSDIFTTLVESHVECSFETFYQTFQIENQQLWADFSANRIDKRYLREQRFLRTFLKLQVDIPELVPMAEEAFVGQMPLQNRLFPGAREVLETLKQNYTLHILSNGFEEAQENKLVQSGIRHCFQQVITSDLAGYRKPSREIFQFALARAGASERESLMIGDDPFVDADAARKCGMSAILFNTSGIDHPFEDIPQINSLPELLPLLKELEEK